jgi:ferric enterobactin receptor
VTKNVSLTGGVDNVFDKRHWRAGNAQTTGSLTDVSYMAGAGAIPITNQAAPGI